MSAVMIVCVKPSWKRQKSVRITVFSSDLEVSFAVFPQSKYVLYYLHQY